MPGVTRIKQREGLSTLSLVETTVSRRLLDCLEGVNLNPADALNNGQRPVARSRPSSWSTHPQYNLLRRTCVSLLILPVQH